ncbi:hypothetical protein Nepgr_028901 [Nepenthes gracilis]|uniref:Uncharacterized protein n=1 Tax=Nepenthes gracilis TaxID=150966 RepID=A0AAD3Y2T8_NEPGR|nr:hypothetical protein Nepgr_028901 [Nepenthes gracilis]
MWKIVAIVVFPYWLVLNSDSDLLLAVVKCDLLMQGADVVPVADGTASLACLEESGCSWLIYNASRGFRVERWKSADVGFLDGGWISEYKSICEVP